MVMAITAINLTTLSLESHNRHYFVLLTLNITAAIASTLGIISIIRYGLYGIHGKSYLFLTLGIICWFLAEFIVTYYYVMGGEEFEAVSIVDGFWFLGYVFLSLHLFFIIKHLQRKINYKIVIIILILTILFVIYNVISILFSEFIIDENLISVIISLLYPILDLILIAPSAIILVYLRKDYQQSIPWLLSSLSLFINAIADDGYVFDFINGNSQNIWVWELFYVADFIIMSGALFWYNKFHISHHKNNMYLNKS
jgi:hypothetical protein